MRRTIMRGGLALAAAVALTVGTAFADTVKSVTISDFAFAPVTLTVAPGTKVVWTNRDEEPHTVTGIGGRMPFKSAALDTDDSFSAVFDKPGTYKYFCSIHPHMVGEIVVK